MSSASETVTATNPAMMRRQTWAGLTMSDLLLCAALEYFVVIGGTDLGVLTPFSALNALIGAGVVAVWIVELPRRGDLVDRLVVIALLIYLATCVLSAFPRQSFVAATDALAYAAVFSLARWRFARPSAERAVMTVMAVCAVCLSVVVLQRLDQRLARLAYSAGQVPALGPVPSRRALSAPSCRRHVRCSPPASPPPSAAKAGSLDPRGGWTTDRGSCAPDGWRAGGLALHCNRQRCTARHPRAKTTVDSDSLDCQPLGSGRRRDRDRARRAGTFTDHDHVDVVRAVRHLAGSGEPVGG